MRLLSTPLRSAQSARLFRHWQAITTVFVRDGDDFLRIATSLENMQGQRAMGTYLGQQHPD